MRDRPRAEQYREQQDLQDLAFGERIDDGVGDDVQQEGDDVPDGGASA